MGFIVETNMSVHDKYQLSLQLQIASSKLVTNKFMWIAVRNDVWALRIIALHLAQEESKTFFILSLWATYTP